MGKLQAERGDAERLPASARRLVGALLGWYDGHRRRFPWRADPGETPDPYRVWLAEIMLQQTTTATATPYFESFIARWPGFEGLAAAPLEDVLHAWQGLGYYARARNLHACAQRVVENFAGALPETESALLALPGVGPYTAAALMAIAFGRPASVVDGNVLRVVARLAGVAAPLPKSRPVLERLARDLSPRRRPGDFAQAIMDLGATICVPRNPRCAFCPWARFCRAHAAGRAHELPCKVPGREKPVRHGVAFWLARRDGAVLLRRRAPRGLLGGMMEIPSTEWRESPWDLAKAARGAPAPARWCALPGTVSHSFSHFHLRLTVATGRIPRSGGIDGVWCRPERLGDHALPTVMKKIARHALEQAKGA
ncbi:MAG: A/G-specific adenine glycosylase [Alphaproteobacteria bacterium]